MQNSKGKSVENWLWRNEMLCAADNDDHIMCHICAKGFLDSNFRIKQLSEISFLPNFPKFHIIHKNLHA